MGPGRSLYLFCFKYEGFEYSYIKGYGYFNNVTGKRFDKPPAGATWTKDSWVWEDPDDEEDDDEYFD